MSQIREIMKSLRDATARSSRRLALRSLELVSQQTPIDTGHAQSNWVLSVGAPYTQIDGSKDAVSTAAQQAGISRIKRYRIGEGAIWLTNNVPYIVILNLGSSTQAPSAFVEKALNQAVAEERVIRDLERAL
jgi:hypothetical protein